MPQLQRVPTVENGLLAADDAAPIRVDSREWIAWLDAPTTRSFAFRSAEGSLTARKDSRKRGGSYWVAYRKMGGKLRNFYLGKSADVTLARLGEAAATLAAAASAAASGPESAPDRSPPAREPVLGAAPPAAALLPSSPLLRTKLYAPAPTAHLVRRARLVDRLQTMGQRRLGLIVAPAGFGKTTLVSDWVQDARRVPAALAVTTGAPSGPPPGGGFRIAWLSLDERDNDPVQFWTYVVVALQTVQAGIGAAALALLRSVPPPPLDQVLTLLMNDLAAAGDALPAAAPTGIALILDDYHAITTQAIHDSLAFLLDGLPAGVRLVITSRHDPPLPLARLRARGQLLELRAADLRFTAAESAQFLNDCMGLHLTPADIEALEGRTEGWIAGLQLAALSMHDSADRTGFIRALIGSRRYVLDYLVEEVLRHQPPAIQRFLLQTSILERLCAELCDAVIIEPEAGAVMRDATSPPAEAAPAPGVDSTASGGAPALAYVEAANLFVTPLDDERRWFRYHPLFADVLRLHLQQTYPALVPVLHRHAAGWYEQQGEQGADMRAMRDSALQHWLAAGAPADITRAAALVERSGATLWAHGDLAAVREWLERLPEQAIYTRPWLAVWYAWALQSNSELEAVPGLLAAAEQGLANAGITDRQSLRGWIAAIRSHLARNHEEFDRAIALAQEALTEFPPGDHAGRIAAQWGLALAQHMRGDLRQALLSYGDTADLFTAARDTFLNGLMRCLQAHVLYEQAQLQAAAEPIRRLVALAQQTAGEPAPGEATVPPVAGWALIERGRVAFARNDLAQAERLLHEGIALAQRGAIRDAVCVGYDALVRIGLAQGDAGGAQAAAESFTRMAEETQFPLYLEWASAVTARVHLAQGNVPAAVAWAVAYQPRPEALFYSHKVAYATFIRVLIAQQQFDEALRWIDRQLAPAERMGHVLTAIELHVLRAVAEQARGDTPAALDALDAALTLAAPEGITRLFLDEGPLLARLLAQSAARTGRSDKRYSFIRLLLLALPLASPAGAQAAELGLPVAPATAQAGDGSVRGLFEPLTPREVEILRLIAAGRSTQEMAAELVVTAGTVKTHLHHLYGKLEARDRVHALIRARELGLIE